MTQGKTTPLDGLEPTTEVVFSCEAGEKQDARRQIGLDLAAALLDGPLEWTTTEEGPAIVNQATGELVDDRSAAFAALLAFAADESNHVAGLLDGKDGAQYIGGTALWKPSLRIDPNWMETMRRRSRGRAAAALRHMMDGLTEGERLARREGWKQRLTLKLLTLTMPHVTGATTYDETKRINRALQLLKKRTEWEGVAGGIKGVEDALDFSGPHVHAHLLILSKYHDRDELAEAWRSCVDTATREAYGFGLAEDCIPFIDLRQVRKKARKDQAAVVSWDDALNEVTKYITKPSDFLKPDELGRKIPRAVLLELCEVRRWPRMFELLGRCRENHQAKKGKAASAALDSIRRAYSAGWVPKIPNEVGWELVEAWDSELDGPEDMRKLALLGLKSRPPKAGPKIRPPSWRDLLDQISLSDWLGIMADRFRRGRDYRIGQLLEANPNGYLLSMKGKAYGIAPAGA